MRHYAGLWIVVLLAVALAGCDAFQQMMEPTATPTGGMNTPTIDQAQAIPYNGPLARIAVLDFDQKSAQGYAQIGQGMADMLATELINTNRYIVLERQKLAGVLAEQDLARDGRIQPGTGAPTGQVEGAELLVTGAVTEFEPNYQGGGVGVGGIGVGRHHHSRYLGGGGIGLGVKQAYVAIDMRAIDARTSRILFAQRVEGRASDAGGMFGVLAGGRHALMGVGLGGFQNTPMEKAVRLCISQAVAVLVSKTPAQYFHYNQQGQAMAPAAGGTVIGPPGPSSTPTPGVITIGPAPAQPTPPTPPQPPQPAQPTQPQATPAQPGLPAQVYVAFATVNVYEKPDANSQLVATAAKGAALRIQKEEGSWYFVAAPDGKIGWVLKAFTSATAPQP